jgi:ABC-2 type transport system ATP-binding protein
VSSPAVVVDTLVKRYAGRAVVDGVSFTVPAGSLVAVLGPNGAGKTTTVETCEGFRRPDGGSVRVLGLDPIRDGRALRPQVGVMLQSGGIYPGARAAEVLELFASFYADPLPVDALLERLGLGTVRGTTYRRLSGGQQQRLSLAVAIVGRPRVLFLDEPTAGLDPQARQVTWVLIDELRADGVGVLLTTHSMEEADRLADRVVIVDDGRVVADGAPAELTAGRDGQRLTFRAPSALTLSTLAESLPAGVVTSEPTPGHYLVTGDIDAAVFATVSSWCATQGVVPDDMQTGRRTLEDVFLELTGKDLRS